MVTRRQQKIARVVKEVVSDAITNHLSDPRVEEGFVSVTRVDISTDLRKADVYLSIFGKTDAADEKKILAAITNAKKRIQSLLARKMQSRFCLALCFYKDSEFKKTMETIRLIDKAVGQSQKKEGEIK